ncbi:MAG: RIP metalloprotease RseP [Candidatus Hydrogenedentota bacterium]
MDYIYKLASTLFAFAIVIGPAIFFHELGHFYFAKRFGVKVFTFSIGFGKRIWSKTYNGTEYCLSWIPLGGYIKMAGEDPTEQHAGAPDEFPSKPVWQRAIIIAAGPIANIILGFVLCVFIFLVGPESPAFMPKVGGVPEKLADVVRVGDVIESIDGEKVASWDDIERMERAAIGRPVTLGIDRGGENIEVKATPIPRKYPENLPWLVKVQVAVDDMMMGNGMLGLDPWVDPVIGQMTEGSPADLAGLKPGDRLVQFAGKPLTQWSDLAMAIRGAPLGEETVERQERWWSIWFPSFLRPPLQKIWPEETWKVANIPQQALIVRDGKEMTIEVAPKTVHAPKPDGGIESFAAIGISPVMKQVPQGPVRAVVSGVFMTARLGKLIVDTLIKLVSGEVSAKLLSGPIGIAQASGSQMREGGIMQLIYFLALISVNLGVVNLFPYPLLDGGWLFIFFLYEIMARKPLSPKAMERFIKVGIAGLLTLVVFITWNDLGRIIGFQKVDDIMRESRQK